ncbi:hypothetical protein ACOMHN_022564 [Nucella lapillus]
MLQGCISLSRNAPGLYWGYVSVHQCSRAVCLCPAMLQGCMGVTSLSSNAPRLYAGYVCAAMLQGCTSLSSNAPWLYGAYGSVQQCSRAVWGLRLCPAMLQGCIGLRLCPAMLQGCMGLTALSSNAPGLYGGYV